MKKTKIIMICYICIGLLIFTACGETKTFPENISCKTILDAAATAETYDNTKTYTKDKDDLDAFLMSMWSDGIFAECEDFDIISDYAICYSNDNTTYEIAVLKATSNENVSKLVSLLERRKQTLSEGDKAEYDPNFNLLMNDAKILTDGCFAMLLITSDNNAVIEAIENLKE